MSKAHRVVKGVRWARFCDLRPSVIPVGRPRGVKALGIKYEKLVAEALKKMPCKVLHGQWIEFEDANGGGYAQPDFLFRLEGGPLVIVETKLSWVAEGHSQIELLYKPLMHALGAEVIKGIVVCKNLKPGVNVPVRGTIGAALAAPAPHSVVHWPTIGPLIGHLPLGHLPSTLAMA